MKGAGDRLPLAEHTQEGKESTSFWFFLEILENNITDAHSSGE